jgi:tetratricopeptide (TPR) repeat protein
MPDDLPDPHHRRAPAPEPLPDSPEPVEIAMDLERHDPSPDSPARRLLVNQNRLVGMQIASERMGVALKMLTALAGLAAAAVLAVLVWEAARAEALVVTPFSVPPELAQRGMTGQVVATRLLDGLATLQAETLSNRPQGAYANDWGDDVQVEIPQTGVSIGELQDFLRGWLGRETNITGEIVRTPTGYTVTARAGADAGKTFAGTEAELDQLILKASEAVYAATQPGRYAGWLVDKQRPKEAIEVYRRLSISGDRKGRAWAFAEWSALGEDPAERLRLAERAASLDPKQPTAFMALSAAHQALGHKEAALRADRRLVELLGGPRKKELPAWSAVFYRKEKMAELASSVGDHARAAELYQSAAEPTPDQPPIACQRCSSAAFFYAARELTLNHDPAAADRMVERAAAVMPAFAPLFRENLNATKAAVRRDWPAMLAIIDSPSVQARFAQLPAATRLRLLNVSRAQVLARLGRVAEAQALIAPTPTDCYDCVRARGVVAASAGNTGEAERWFAEAVRQAPSVPGGYSAWGEARMARGDVEGAIRLFREAQERGPRWADPLKYEGDALARQRKHREAARRYEQAAERAPTWGALHLAWGRSLAAAGEREEALARYRQAARLDLTPADRAAVQRLLGAPVSPPTKAARASP